MMDSTAPWLVLLLLSSPSCAHGPQQSPEAVESEDRSLGSLDAAGIDLETCDLSRTVEQMQEYLVFNAPFHNGFVLDHSLWTASSVANWIASGDDWVAGIPGELKTAAVLLAFLHDIGKVGDRSPYLDDGDGGFQVQAEKGLLFNWKTLEPSWGFEYLIGKRNFDWKADECEECVSDYGQYLLRACPMSNREISILAVGVGMHYSFGDYLKGDISEADYLNRVRRHSCKSEDVFGYLPDASEIGALVRMFSVIGAADTQGAHPVELQADDESSRFIRDLAEPEARYPSQPANAQAYVKFGLARRVESMEQLAAYVSTHWQPDCP